MAEEVKSEKVEGTKDAAAGAQADDKSKEVPFNDHPRWIQVYGELKEFKKLGLSPADLTTRLQEGQELKTAFEEAARQAADEAGKKGGEDEANKVYKQAREELRKVFPEIDAIAKLQEAHDARYARLEKAALSETKKVLETAGLGTADKEILSLSDILADIIKNDDDLYAEYETSPKAAVRGAWEKYVERVRPAVERSIASSKQKDGETRKGLPKTHGSGGGEGGSAGKDAPEPKTLVEAEKRAMARLRGMQE